MSTVVKPEILTVMRAAQENFEKQFKTQLDRIKSIKQRTMDSRPVEKQNKGRNK